MDIGKYELDLEDFARAFESLEDPREDINQWHPLISVLAISVMAILAGAGEPSAIADWAAAKADWLMQLLPLPYGVPKKDTFRRVLMSLNPTEFQSCFASWIKDLLAVHENENDDQMLLSIDGKTLRRSHDKAKHLGALHSVSVWAGEYGLTLAQVACDEKSNEITVIPQALKLVNVKGAIVTIDAMGTQKEIAKQIVDGGGDYVLALKGNQGNFHKAVVEYVDRQLERYARLDRVRRGRPGHGHRAAHVGQLRPAVVGVCLRRRGESREDENTISRITVRFNNIPVDLDTRMTEIDVTYPGWRGARAAEKEVLFALPKADHLGWGSVLPPDRNALYAERVYFEFCQENGIDGLNPAGVVTSPMLRTPAPFSQKLVESMKGLGWTEQQIRHIPAAMSAGDDVRTRTQGAAGWLICNKAFRDGRDALRREWGSIEMSRRPPFPLLRPPIVTLLPQEAVEPLDIDLARFAMSLDQFCDRWRIRGFTTWELPEPEGPKWPNYLPVPGAISQQRGELRMDTPPHFPLNTGDGIGQFIAERHAEDAVAIGFEEQHRWTVYRQLLLINFWQDVLESRYAGRKRPRGWITHWNGMLGEILEVDAERVKKLRGLLDSFKCGVRSTLEGWR